jgi:hypothetical protein
MEQKLNEFLKIPPFAQQAALDIIKDLLAAKRIQGPDKQVELIDLSTAVKNAITSLYIEQDSPSEKLRSAIKNEWCKLEFNIPTEEDFREMYGDAVAALSDIPANRENRWRMAGLVMVEVQRRLLSKIDFSVTTLYPE